MAPYICVLPCNFEVLFYLQTLSLTPSMGELIIKYQHQEQYFTFLQEGKIVKIFKSCGPAAATHTVPLSPATCN